MDSTSIIRPDKTHRSQKNTCFYLTTLLVFFVSINFDVLGQRFYSVVFNKLPQDYQLYPRSVKNEATVPVSGIIEVPGYTHMSVLVTRNDTPLKYLRAAITYNSKGIGSFSTETIIKAELAGYNFSVYACKPSDSILIVKRQKVVSGDTYILMGQSNSTGFFVETQTSEYCRSFGKITGNLNTDPYNPADTLWGLSNAPNLANVGTMGLEIQKQLSQKSGIPNCLINGGFHWSTAYNQSIRNKDNPADINTGYGRMLFRLQKAGLAKSPRTLIYRQGESEAYHDGFGWEQYFKVFYDNLKIDLPSLEKLYVFQIDIIYYPSLTGAQLRDYQRRLPEIYKNIRNLATVGTKQFDGLHYGYEGNVQGGLEVSRLIYRDLYGSQDTLNINSPNVKKVFYKTVEKKEIVLAFDEGQQLSYPGPYKPNNNTSLDLKDFIYLDDVAGAVSSGVAVDSRITLTLKSPQTATRINYLPPYLQEGGSYYPFNGPMVTNSRGMRAFTFYNVPIGQALETPKLTAKLTSSTIALEWNGIKDATGYLLERKPEGESQWKVVSNSTLTSFTDNPGTGATKLNYRLKAVGATSESADYGYANVEMQVITGVTQEPAQLFQAYPNPARISESIVIRFAKPASGTLSIFDKSGRKLSDMKLRQSSEARIDAKIFPQGYNFVRFESGNILMDKKIFITP